jgi:hypothetical protein
METINLNESENSNVQKADENNSNYEAAWKLLGEKGLAFGEKIKVRKAFSEWGKGFDENIEKDYKTNTYLSKKRKGYGFNKEEEVKFFNALIDLSPNTDTETIIQVMCMVNKLLDVESVYSFSGKR